MRKKHPQSLLKPLIPTRNHLKTKNTKAVVEQGVSVGKHDIDNLDQWERELYNLIVEKGIDTDLLYFMSVLASVADDQLDYMFSINPYWQTVASAQAWKDEVLPLVREGLTDYLYSLRVELAKTSNKLELNGEEPLSDQRARTIAISEITNARTAAAIILVDINNGIASGQYQED